MEYPPELLKGTFAPIVLALLAERAMYGYEMVKLVDARSGGRLRWREGTLYPTLHKLETDGHVTAEWRAGQGGEGARERKYYAITAGGRRELAKRSAEFRDFSATMATFLPLKLGGGEA